MHGSGCYYGLAWLTLGCPLLQQHSLKPLLASSICLSLNPPGESPLALAAATNATAVVELLLGAGAKASLRQEPQGTAPIHRAACAQVRMVKATVPR